MARDNLKIVEDSTHVGGDRGQSISRFASTAITVTSVIMSVVTGVFYVGMQVAQVRSELEETVRAQREDRVEFKQQITQLATSVSSLNVSLSGMTISLKNLADELGMERQERITNDARSLRK